MDARGTVKVPLHGPKAGTPEVGEFPHILLAEGDKSFDGLSRA